MGKSIETESDLWVAVSEGEGNAEWLPSGRGLSFQSDENVLEVDSDDSCTTLEHTKTPVKCNA